MQRIQDFPRLSEKQVLQQVKSLRTQGSATSRSLIDWVQRGLIPPPQGRGGRGRRKTYAPETAAEIYANTQLFVAATFTLAQIRTTRELGLIIENAPNLTSENCPAEIRRLSDAFGDKEFYLAAVRLWLREKWAALRRLYQGQLTITPRIESFADRGLQFFIWGLHTGFYRNYTLSPEGRPVAIATTGNIPEPQEAINAFAQG